VGVAGDIDGSYVRFVRDQTPVLLRSAYLLTHDAGAAEELVQETLVRLYPQWGRVLAADVPLAYVRRSLVNGFLNQRRRPASRELLISEMPDEFATLDIAHQVTDRRLLWQLLASLPDRQRAAIVLRYFQDLPDEEIAAALRCRTGTVRSLLSRGLATLRLALPAQSSTGDGQET
jgi:RNA polymerase sigma-70 factor (sigma-E family)